MEVQGLQIAVFAAVGQMYSYLPPTQTCSDLSCLVGYRVLVPLGNRQVVGIVVAVAELTCQAKDGQLTLNLQCSGGESTVVVLKKVTKFLDNCALFDVNDMRLARWISSFYLYPLGGVLMQMLPTRLRKVRETVDRSLLMSDLKVVELSVRQQKTLVNSPDFQLNMAQQQVLSQLYPKLSGYSCSLLYGHTNSGKTEIYLRLTEQVLCSGYQVLILVPEIGLTPQTIQRFKQRFPATNLVFFHSQLTDKGRLVAWQRCFVGEAQVVIGTRSAVFLPLTRLGIIILDEEHDSSFKQDSQLRYSAREVAVVKGKMLDIPVVLGSATPSIESWYNALHGQYSLLTLSPRNSLDSMHGSASSINLQIVDASKERIVKGFSNTVLHAIEHCLIRGQQVLIFLNRRGFAATVFCSECGWSAECPHCDNHLTLHKALQRLVCHHCEYHISLPVQCPQCGCKQLGVKGLGTEGLEETLNAIFPGYRIARIDRDTTSRKGALNSLLEGINNNEYQILVGTQILAKGHHFPRVTLVAIMNVDAGLFSGDFHHEEQLAQLVVQVMGRAGRGDLPGRVILQTNYPGHPIFYELQQQNYTAFLQRCLAERQEAVLPPFSCHAVLQAEARRRSAVWNFLQRVAEISRGELKYLQVWGPAALCMERKAGFFRAQLVFQASSHTVLHQALKRVDSYIRQQKVTLKWFWDINPSNLLSA